MLNATDPGTITSINLLKNAVGKGKPPLLIWIGAGASRWAGLPSWKDLARKVLHDTTKYASPFDPHLAKEALKKTDFPKVFQLCHSADSAVYNNSLVRHLSVGELNAVYRNLVKKLEALETIRVLTTNVDTLLEQSIPRAAVVERSDVERISTLLAGDTSFVVKLHGSLSSIGSCVFTEDEYELLKKNKSYIEGLSWC